MVSHARTFSGIAVVAAGLVAWCGAGPVSALHSATAKMSRIAYDRAPRGSVIVFSAAELAAFARDQAETLAPAAIRDLQVLLSVGHADVSASVDFLKIRQAQGEADTWLMRQLLGGARPVRVRVALVSSNGRARVDVERVEVSGIPMEGKTLDFLIHHFVIPNFPDARVGEWFALQHSIDRITLRAGAAAVSMRR